VTAAPVVIKKQIIEARPIVVAETPKPKIESPKPKPEDVKPRVDETKAKTKIAPWPQKPETFSLKEKWQRKNERTENSDSSSEKIRDAVISLLKNKRET
jgi:hypothetical protein